MGYVLNPYIKNRFEEKATQALLIACGETFYYLMNPTSGKIYKNKHVRFIEYKVYGDYYRGKKSNSTIKDPPIVEGEEGTQFFSEVNSEIKMPDFN